MSKKFDSVPVENDTRILHNQEMNLGEYGVLHQKWKWEAITAESIIFLTVEHFLVRKNQHKIIPFGAPITVPMGSDILSDNGCSSHTPMLPFNPGCINPACENYREWNLNQD